jgi:hypothetical protein
MWCIVAGRQRINANGFLISYDLFSWKKKHSVRINSAIIVTKFNFFRRPLTLFAPILLHHVWLDWSSSSLPMLSLPSLSTDCLSFLPPGGSGPPSPPYSKLTLFSSDPGNSPPLHWAQLGWGTRTTDHALFRRSSGEAENSSHGVDSWVGMSQRTLWPTFRGSHK